MEGMVALSMVAPDLPPLIQRLEAGRTPRSCSGAGELTVEPKSSHGVPPAHLPVSRSP